jgi:hypothetical protein
MAVVSFGSSVAISVAKCRNLFRPPPDASRYPPLACAPSLREISAMKRPESPGKSGTATEWKPEDFDDFDYYWQHLRRNYGYGMAAIPFSWNAAALRGSRPRPLAHQWREFEARCLLPTPVAPGIEDTEDALREVLKKKPDFFQTPQWQTIKAKAMIAEPVAYWNFTGPARCAWRNYYDGEKYFDKLWKDPRQDYYEHFAFRKDPHHPEMHHVGREFEFLHMNLEITERVVGNLKELESWAKRDQRTVEEERKLKQAECDDARMRMRRFLEAHPRMDFVADTRLPWATVSRAMESEWERIKDLRRRVRLEANEQPARKREWKKQLEVYDAYFPHWLENRKKFAVLLRIWRDNLGFQESFKLLEVELTPEAAALARLMDKGVVMPKGVFKFTDRFLKDLGRASYENAAPLGLSGRSKPKHGSGAKGVFDDESQPVAVTEFDYDAVDALLDGGEVSDVEPGTSSEWNEAALNTLHSWRVHFSIPKPALPPSLASLRGDTRREWFHAARKRIEALWPPTEEPAPT